MTVPDERQKLEHCGVVQQAEELLCSANNPQAATVHVSEVNNTHCTQARKDPLAWYQKNHMFAQHLGTVTR